MWTSTEQADEPTLLLSVFIVRHDQVSCSVHILLGRTYRMIKFT